MSDDHPQTYDYSSIEEESAAYPRADQNAEDSSPLTSANQPKYGELASRNRDLESENFNLKMELSDLMKFKRYIPKIQNKTEDEVFVWITTTVQENEVLKNKNQDLEDKMKRIDNDFNKFEAEAKDRIGRLEHEKRLNEGKHEMELDSKIKELSGYKKQLEEVTNSLAKQEAENEELRRHIPADGIKDIDMRRLSTPAFTQNLETLKERERELAETHAQLTARSTENDAIRDQLTEAREQLIKKEDEIQSLKAELADFQGFEEMPSTGNVSAFMHRRTTIGQTNADRRSILTDANITQAFFNDGDFELLRLTIASQPSGMRRTTHFKASAENLRHIVNRLFEELRGCGIFIQQLLDKLGDHIDADLTKLVIDFKKQFDESVSYAQDLVSASEVACAEAQAADQELNMVVDQVRRLTGFVSTANDQQDAADGDGASNNRTYELETPVVGNYATSGQKEHISNLSSTHTAKSAGHRDSSTITAHDASFDINEAMKEAYFQEQDRALRLQTEVQTLRAELARVEEERQQAQGNAVGDATTTHLQQKIAEQAALLEQMNAISQAIRDNAQDAQVNLVEGGAPALVDAIKQLFEKVDALKQDKMKLESELHRLRSETSATSVDLIPAEHAKSSDSSHSEHRTGGSASEKSSMWAELIRTKEELSQAHAHIEEMRRKAADDADLWKLSVQNSEETAIEMQEKYKAAADQLSALQNDVEERESQLAELEQALEQRDMQLAELDEYAKQLDEARQHKERLCDVVDELMHPIEKVYDNLRAKKRQSSTGDSDHSDRSSNDNVTGSTADRYLALMHGKGRKMKMVTVLTRRFETNYAQLESAISENEKLLAATAKLEEERERAENDREMFEKEYKSYASQLEKASFENERLKDQVEHLVKSAKQASSVPPKKSGAKAHSESDAFGQHSRRSSTEQEHHRRAPSRTADAEQAMFLSQFKETAQDVDRLINEREQMKQQIAELTKEKEQLQQQRESEKSLTSPIDPMQHSPKHQSTNKVSPSTPLQTPKLASFNESCDAINQSAQTIRRRLRAIAKHAEKFRDSTTSDTTRHYFDKFIATANSAEDEVEDLFKQTASAQHVAESIIKSTVQSVDGCERHEAIIDYLRSEVSRLEAELNSMHEKLKNDDIADIKDALRAQLKRITSTLHSVKRSVTTDPNIEEDFEAEQRESMPTSSKLPPARRSSKPLQEHN